MVAAATALVTPSLVAFAASRPSDLDVHLRVFYTLFMNGAQLQFRDFGGKPPVRAAGGEAEGADDEEEEEEIGPPWGAEKGGFGTHDTLAQLILSRSPSPSLTS